MFELQWHTQDSMDIPHFSHLLRFIDLRHHPARPLKHSLFSKQPVSHFATTQGMDPVNCSTCKKKHPLYSCLKFKALDQSEKMTVVKSHKLCINCLHPDHVAIECGSSHHCKQWQWLHHTLLHENIKVVVPQNTHQSNHVTSSLHVHILCW